MNLTCTGEMQDTNSYGNNQRNNQTDIEIACTNCNESDCSKLNVCRICQECCSGDPGLIAPCRCKGSIGFVHERCLVEWLSKSGKSTCEICCTSYVLRASTAGWRQWRRLQLSRHDLAMMAVNIVCIIFLISTTAWLIWSALSVETKRQRNSDLFRVCYALYGFMDIFCLGILLHEIPHMRLMYRHYKLLKYELRVMPYTSPVVSINSEDNTNTSETTTLQIVDPTPENAVLNT
uniref:RING-type E3 ubiquitin transferase n=1 Tax=Ciona savignyi TaxID=51511 RepID=H2Y4C4_CIOSA